MARDLLNLGRSMFPALLILALAYLPCVLFLRASLAKAPEAYEDDSGFHWVRQESPAAGRR